MQLELRHLNVVLSVAAAGSISRAAAQLKIAQSGLTAQLQRIEQELGGTLFTRGSGGVALTELGEHVAVHAREVIGRFDSLLETSRVLAQHDEPSSPVQVCGMLGPVVPMLVAAVREVLPDRELSTRLEHRAETVHELLRSGELDVAVVADLPESALPLPAGVTSRALCTEPAFAGLAVDHPLADRPELRLADLAEDDWVTVAEPGLGRQFRLACQDAGFAPHCPHQGADLATAAMLVQSGHAVSVFYPTPLPLPGVVLRPLVGDPLRRRLSLVWRDSSPVAEEVDEIHTRLRKRYRGLIADHPAYARWWADHDDPADALSDR